jgi:mono/diheme cytochrome c family protein
LKKILILICLIGLILPTMALGDGKDDFSANCNKCHGGNAKTNIRRALLLKIDPKKLYLNASEMNPEAMGTIIEKGKNQMPGFELQLTKEKISALVDYVMSLRKNNK